MVGGKKSMRTLLISLLLPSPKWTEVHYCRGQWCLQGLLLCWLRSTSFTHVYALSFLLLYISSFNVSVPDLVIWFSALVWRTISGEKEQASLTLSANLAKKLFAVIRNQQIPAIALVCWTLLMCRMEIIKLYAVCKKMQKYFPSKKHNSE